MRTRITMIICLCLLFAGRASAQWVVSDPGNLAQGIINASKNIIHTSKTATNMVSNFQETVKIYQQGKKYYDALKSVNNLVKDARKVQQTILMSVSTQRTMENISPMAFTTSSMPCPIMYWLEMIATSTSLIPLSLNRI